MMMKSARRIFPWVLHIDAGIVAALNLNSADFEIVAAAGDANHSGWRGFGWLRWRDRNNLLWLEKSIGAKSY